jgi:23S rRNA pseudouridine2457 synthase
MHRYYLFYKPFQVLSQYQDAEGKAGIGSVCKLPPRVYPVGRLDYDSEGLLLLTSNPRVNAALLHPSQRHERAYYAQVEGMLTAPALALLEAGVQISVEGKAYRTLPAQASLLEAPPALPPRQPPIRHRASVPTSWLSLVLMEGKNRQVRKMTAAVGHPTLRLVRWRIGQLLVEGLEPGQLLELPEKTFLRKLGLMG